jgi:hypothetical protein
MDEPTNVAGIKQLQDDLHGMMAHEDLKWKQWSKENGLSMVTTTQSISKLLVIRGKKN